MQLNSTLASPERPQFDAPKGLLRSEGFSGYYACVATGGIPTQDVFILRKPTEVRQDGYRATHTPFVISYDGREVYAAFTDAAVAAYFVSALGLDVQYQAVPLSKSPTADLTDAEYLLVLRRKSQIDALLQGRIVPSSFARDLLKVR